MKIFISWSGSRSHQVAALLDEWIQCVIQAVDPWLSSRDIDKGSLWFTEISDSLKNTQNGIICLTKSNLAKPWILFESGALAKGISSNRIFTFLIDLEPNDIKDPLAQFNHTKPIKSDMYSLLRTINNGLGEKMLKEQILKNVFETYWPSFEKQFKTIIKNTPDEDIEIERSNDDIMNEILNSIRGFDKRLRNIEKSDYSEQIIHNLRKTPIEDINLSVRTINAIKAAKINYWEDLIHTPNSELMEHKSITEKVINEIVEQIHL